MDSAMRDLERLEERGEGRPLALVGILIGVTVTLVLAMGMAVGSWGEEEMAPEDPLAHLDEAPLRSAGLAPSEAEQAPLPEVDRASLSFPEALAPADERPEVAAAMVAAAAELAHPDPLGLPAPTVPAALPAGVAARTEPAELARSVARDPLMAEALPPAPPARAAPQGRDGPYTVQVISYDSPEGAEAFAASLRERGHRAFVMRAEIEGRGEVYRVRVGPFETEREAQAYRQEFERTERMATLLVRRRAS